MDLCGVPVCVEKQDHPEDLSVRGLVAPLRHLVHTSPLLIKALEPFGWLQDEHLFLLGVRARLVILVNLIKLRFWIHFLSRFAGYRILCS